MEVGEEGDYNYTYRPMGFKFRTLMGCFQMTSWQRKG